jgi:hypothetical protein
MTYLGETSAFSRPKAKKLREHHKIGIYRLTLKFLCVSYIPVHPGRGLGHDGDHRWGGCGACGSGENVHQTLGSPGAALRTLGSARREAVRQPAGVADVQFQEAKIAAKAWTRAPRHSRTNRPAYLRELASTQPFASSHSPRKRHYRFHPRRSYAQRSLTSESHFTSPQMQLTRRDM